MMNPNPEESRKRGEELKELMRKFDLREEMKKPGKNGPTLDPLIPDRTPPKRPK